MEIDHGTRRVRRIHIDPTLRDGRLDYVIVPQELQQAGSAEVDPDSGRIGIDDETLCLGGGELGRADEHRQGQAHAAILQVASRLRKHRHRAHGATRPHTYNRGSRQRRRRKGGHMARVPLVDDEQAHPEVREVLSTLTSRGLGPFEFQARALANHPAFFKAIMQLLHAYRNESVVPKRYIDQAVLAVSTRNACEYCIVHHTPPAVDSGVSVEKIEQITKGSWRDSDAFDETERLVLEYAEQLTDDPNRVGDELFAALRQRFDAQQLIELTVRIAMCGFFNRFNSVLWLDVEPLARKLYQGATGGPRS